MIKRVKKLLAISMMYVLLVASIPGANFHVYAAEGKTLNADNAQTSAAIDTSNLYHTEKRFPVGTALLSDGFDGLKVTYDGMDSYSIKKGEQTVILSVTVLDEAKAKAGIEKLTLMYGMVGIVNKKGATTVFVCKITGVDPTKSALPKNTAQFQSSDSDSAEDHGSDDKENATTRTVILYIIGADIESDKAMVTRQLLDVLESDIPDYLRVILVTGGSELWHMDDPECYKQYVTETLFPGRASYDKCTNEEKARIDAEATRLLEKYSTEISGVQIWTIENSGSSNSLKLLRTADNEYAVNPDFITDSIDFATTYAPAQKYDLILSGHGSGLSGFGVDDLYKAWSNEHPDEDPVYTTPIPIPTIAEALSESSFIKNGNKFELLGFDSCLMGSFEVACSLSEYADYFVASEENEADNGWLYSGMIRAVRENPTITGVGLSNAITDSYANQYAGTTFTLSGVDLKQMDRLDDALTTFSSLLYSEADENFYHIMNGLEGDSHFDNKHGYGSSNLYDLKRIAETFSEDERYSEELRSASRDLVNTLSDAVIANFEGTDENGGLSIYFPRQAMYFKIFEDGYLYYNDAAEKHLTLYEENGFNEAYTELVKKLAFRDLVGIWLGKFLWQNEDELSPERLLNALEINELLQHLADPSEIDKSDPDDPYVQIVQKQIDERIHTGKITATVPERIYDDEEHWHYEDAADVHVDDTDSELTEDRLLVEVTLEDTGTSLGSTVTFSNEKTGGAEEDGRESLDYTVSAFDQKWYTLNGQISSMYLTEAKEDLSGYSGHIPLLQWKTAEYAAGTEEDNQDRDQYLIDASMEDKFRIIWLNVDCNISTDANGNVQQDLTPTNAEVVDIRILDSERYMDIKDLADKYYEILGGADGSYNLYEEPVVSSLGTVYIDNAGDIDIDTAYVDNLSPTYYFTDVFNADYSLTNENLGEDDEGNPKGMDDFYQPIPEDVPKEEILTWDESQLLAEQIREQAAQEAQAIQETQEAAEIQEAENESPLESDNIF
jgi:hypothetical protein